MEQQTISGSKAGTLSKLNARTTILAACNPVLPGQKYNPHENLEKNTGLSSPILSRFDLTFVVTDTVNYEADEENCDFILDRFMKPEERTFQRQHDVANLWDIDKLREYIKYIKTKFEPQMTPEAEQLIMAYYKHMRTLNTHR